MRIAIDIDDTITNSYDLIISEVSRYYNLDGNKMKQSGITYQEIMDDNITFPDYEKFVKNYFESFMINVTLKENAAKMINKLYEEGNEIFFVTARNKNEYRDPYMFTYDFLMRNNIFFDKIYAEVKNKGIFCKEHNIDILVDDSVQHCQSALENGLDILLYDNVFNYKNTSLKRVYNWIGVYNLLTKKNNS